VGNNKNQINLSLQHHVRGADSVVPHEKLILKNTDKNELCLQLRSLLSARVKLGPMCQVLVDTILFRLAKCTGFKLFPHQYQP
jgi:hypothetical protein